MYLMNADCVNTGFVFSMEHLHNLHRSSEAKMHSSYQ